MVQLSLRQSDAGQMIHNGLYLMALPGGKQ